MSDTQLDSMESQATLIADESTSHTQSEDVAEPMVSSRVDENSQDQTEMDDEEVNQRYVKFRDCTNYCNFHD